MEIKRVFIIVYILCGLLLFKGCARSLDSEPPEEVYSDGVGGHHVEHEVKVEPEIEAEEMAGNSTGSEEAMEDGIVNATVVQDPIEESPVIQDSPRLLVVKTENSTGSLNRPLNTTKLPEPPTTPSEIPTPSPETTFREEIIHVHPTMTTSTTIATPSIIMQNAASVEKPAIPENCSQFKVVLI
jgi:hypothetical protein